MARTTVGMLLLAALLWGTEARAETDAFDRVAFDVASERVGDVVSKRVDPWAPRARDDWKFFVAPYGWLASVEGSVVAGGESTDVEIPFEDLTEFVNGGFQLYAEIRWKRLFVAFDGTWAELGTQATGTLLQLDVDITQRIFDMRVGYELHRCTLDGTLDPCCERWRRWLVVDAYVGVRYWYTKTEVALRGQGPIGIEADLEGVDERWDPFVGARFGIDLTPRWSFGMRGDVGGFGIGDAAELAWTVQGGFSYDLQAWMHLFFGWRALGFDTVTGSGTSREGADLVQHGPLVGLGFSF